jgi:hypothetical protein
MRKLLLLMLAGLLLAGTPASATGPLTAVDTGKSALAAPTAKVSDLEVWCQMPELTDWAKIASQIDTAYPFDAGAADDYESPTDYAITEIMWWGGQWNYDGYPGAAPPCTPDYFVITFYMYDGCVPPDPAPVAPDYLPHNYFHQEVITMWDETVLDSGYDLRAYRANIGPVLQDANRTYWLEIQAGLSFQSCGQWGWLTTMDPAWGCFLQRGFPLLGQPYWSGDQQDNGVAFCLYSDRTVAAQSQTWGAVKDLYR